MSKITRKPGSKQEHQFAWKSALLTSLTATVIAFFSIGFASSHSTIALLWYPTALFASLMVTQPPRDWSTTLILTYASILLAHLLSNSFEVGLLELLLPVASVAGALTIAWTTRQFVCKPLQLDPAVDSDWFFRIDLITFFRFLAFSVLPGIVVPALLGSLMLFVALGKPWLTNFEGWLAGDGLGAVGLLPFAFCLFAVQTKPVLSALFSLKHFLFAALILLAVFTSTQSDFVLFYTTGILAIAAAVSGLSSTAALTLIVSLIYGYGIEFGLFIDNPQMTADRLLPTYLPLILSLLPGMFIAISRQELDNRLVNTRSMLDQSEQIRAVMTNEIPLFSFVRPLDSENAVYLTPALRQYVYGDTNAPGPYTPQSVFHPDDLAKMREGIQLKQEQPLPYTLEMRIRQSNGQYFWHKIVNYPVLNDAQEVVQRVGVMQDIDDLHQIQSQLRAQTAELTRSNESLETFALAASHDLQEPLRMVVGYTQLLKKRYRSELNEDALSMLDFAADASMQMSHLIQDLLAFSRVAAPGRVDSGEVSIAVESARSLLAVSMQDHTVSLSVEPSIPAVNLTQSALNQLMLNLIANSIRYRSDEDPIISISVLAKDESTLTLSVRDNGIGIDPENHESAFEVFKRFNNTRATEKPGSGIGLSLCHRIVQAAGGHISIVSDGKAGTEFQITLKRTTVNEAMAG